MNIVFHLPGKPRAWKRVRTRGGQHFTDPATRSQQAVVRLTALEAMDGAARLDGPVVLRVRAIFEPPASWSKKKREAALGGEVWPTGRPDVDNIVKLIKDALNGAVWKDDAQVVHAEMSKEYGPTSLTIVSVKPVGAP